MRQPLRAACGGCDVLAARSVVREAIQKPQALRVVPSSSGSLEQSFRSGALSLLAISIRILSIKSEELTTSKFTQIQHAVALREPFIHSFDMAAPAATRPTTYAFVPPPPLPEFYLPMAASSGDSSAASSVSEEVSQALVRTKTKTRVSKQSQALQVIAGHACVTTLDKLPPALRDATDERTMRYDGIPRTTSTPIFALPPPPPGMANDVPPLAIYHVCRICLRPRSTRFHREHPIPINAVPPPPGICRRCRVTKVEEVTSVKDVAKTGVGNIDVMQKSESNEVKIGVAAFVPKEDYVTNREMKDRRGRALLRSLSQRRLRESSGSTSTGETRRITYRHIRVRERTMSPAPIRRSMTIPPPPGPRTTVISTAQDAIRAVSVHSQDAMMTTAVAAATSMQVQPTQMPSSRSTQIGKTASAKAPCRSPTPAPIRARPVSAVKPETAPLATRPERTEAEIRNIAREEVERYRQAERKLDAYPGAYAHGRMVPVERRIERKPEVAEPLPWHTDSDRFEVHVERVKEVVRPPSQPTPRSAPGQRSVRAEKEATVGKAQQAQSDKYTGSCWSSTRSQGNERREIVIERVVRDDPGEDGKSSEMRGMREQRAAFETVNAKSTTAEVRSSASDKTMWAPTDDRPVSVKFRPVLEGKGRKIYETEVARPPSPTKYATLEVVKGVDTSPESKPVPKSRGGRQQSPSRTNSGASKRVQELQEEAERQERTRKKSSASQEDPASERSSWPSTWEYWEEEDAKRTASGQSKHNEVDLRTESSRHAAEPADAPPKAEERVRAFDRRWAAATKQSKKVEGASSAEDRPEERKRGHIGLDSKHPLGPPPSMRSTRSAKAPDTEYYYRVDTLQPTEKPHSMGSPVIEYSFYERGVQPTAESRSTRSPDRELRVYERTVQPADEQRNYKSFQGRPAERSVEENHLLRTRQRPQAAAQPPAPEAKPRNDWRKHQKAEVSPSETSTRVRFANKVEFSPTPPGSDASSAQFRIIGGPGSKARKADGGVESAGDLIVEYERRGRSRARDRAPPAHEDREYYYERVQVPRRTHKEHDEHGHDGQTDRGERSEADDPAYRPRKSRPLATALSESPSRERLSEAFSKITVDGAGPYRPELPRPDSMQTWQGSGHARMDESFGHSHGRWEEDLPGDSAR